MCGLAGLVNRRGLDATALPQRVAKALARLHPRGPDGSDSWRDDCCALVHTRLAIIDLSPGGAQPMQRHGSVISYNGEIFNYRELRAELVALGHDMQTGSDTEVLLAGWRQWGFDLLPRLVGMFAFALWDPASRRLVAARDRFGEKPFLYSEGPHGLAFGSDLLACEAMAGTTYPVDPAALRALFELRFIPDPMTIAAGVRKLPAGHWLSYDADGLTVRRWYHLAAGRDALRAGGTDVAGELRARFDAAVSARLVSDVPVGVFLSGGIDSALVAASVAAQGVRPKTFTVGFEGTSSYFDERPQAASVARHLGADHTEISVPGARAASILDAMFAGLDEPFADASAVPTFLVAQATRQAVTVVLTGDGADEIFAGYRRYWAELYAGQWMSLPAPLRQLLATLVRALPGGRGKGVFELARRAARFVETCDADPLRRQMGWMRELDDRALDDLLGPAPADRYDLLAALSSARDAIQDADPVNAMLAADTDIILASDMLVKVDRMSMANALETRAPFLDQRVVEAAFALPGSTKLARNGLRPQGKAILRRLFTDRLPAEVFTRPKRGFELPVAELLAGPAREALAAATDHSRLHSQGIFNYKEISRWQSDLAAGRKDTSWKLWTLLAFQEWARTHQRPEQF